MYIVNLWVGSWMCFVCEILEAKEHLGVKPGAKWMQLEDGAGFTSYPLDHDWSTNPCQRTPPEIRV